MSTTQVRYDGFQADMFGGGCHCYTITAPGSPAEGASIAFDATMPTPEQIAAAVARKEAEFRKALEETTPYP